MVSLIHSVFGVYGSRATVPPYGFVLHNRGSAFSLDPKSPNIVAPRKRPFHTIIAGFVMKNAGGFAIFLWGANFFGESHFGFTLKDRDGCTEFV
jgi:gamma-glutamyltranspeptidase/glutathione hydrolase